MATPQNEKLSALLDGELSYIDGKQALDCVLTHSEQQAKLARYQTYSACLRSEMTDVDHAELFSRLQQRLAAEPVILAPHAIKNSAPRGLKRFVSGSAIAASVAAAVIIGANYLSPTGQDTAVTIASNNTAPQTLLSPQAVSTDSVNGHLRADAGELDSYLQEHENLLSAGSLGSGLPLATMVGYGGF